MDPYPDYRTYQALYLRYYSGRDVAELLRLLEPLRDTCVLDLCGGDGRLALEALTLGVRETVLVDAEQTMIPPALLQHPKVRVYVKSVHDTLSAMKSRGELFDRIACRQAVNYWLNEQTAELAANVLRHRGIFAFNTFNRKPSEKPRVLQYEIGGHAFVEVSWLIESTVHHLQVRDGMVPHYTSFEWLSPERLHKILGPHFGVVEEKHEKSSLYRCEKK